MFSFQKSFVFTPQGSEINVHFHGSSKNTEIDVWTHNQVGSVAIVVFILSEIFPAVVVHICFPRFHKYGVEAFLKRCIFSGSSPFSIFI